MYDELTSTREPRATCRLTSSCRYLDWPVLLKSSAPPRSVLTGSTISSWLPCRPSTLNRSASVRLSRLSYATSQAALRAIWRSGAVTWLYRTGGPSAVVPSAANRVSRALSN